MKIMRYMNLGSFEQNKNTDILYTYGSTISTPMILYHWSHIRNIKLDIAYPIMAMFESFLLSHYM